MAEVGTLKIWILQVLPNEILLQECPIFDFAKQLRSYLSLDVILQLHTTSILSPQRHTLREPWALSEIKKFNRLSNEKT